MQDIWGPSAGRDSAVEHALEWLRSHHEDAAFDAIAQGFLGSRGEALPERLGALPDDLGLALQVNAFEWLLADGEIEFAGERRRVAELVLGPGGPPLDATERAWLEEMAARPLAFWEVLDSRPGQGLWLSAAFDPDGPAGGRSSAPARRTSAAAT